MKKVIKEGRFLVKESPEQTLIKQRTVDIDSLPKHHQGKAKDWQKRYGGKGDYLVYDPSDRDKFYFVDPKDDRGMRGLIRSLDNSTGVMVVKESTTLKESIDSGKVAKQKQYIVEEYLRREKERQKEFIDDAQYNGELAEKARTAYDKKKYLERQQESLAVVEASKQIAAEISKWK